MKVRILTALMAFVVALPLTLTGLAVYGASIPLLGPGAVEVSPDLIQSYLNNLINQINLLVTPETIASNNIPLNLLNNGAMLVTQRGTAAATCGTTSGPAVTAYGPDRWACDVNVSSGAGSLSVTTSSPTPPPGFINQANFYRTSGSLAQPQCVEQEVPTKTAVSLQGHNATFSVWMAGLANMLAESTTVNMYIFTGTDTDGGLGASAIYGSAVGMTASPAITPAWTNISSSITAAQTISSTYARYSVTGPIPTATTEIAVALCWTPTTGGTSGTTDGFVFTGAQLTPGLAPAIYQFKTYQQELADSLAYYYRQIEPAAGVPSGFTGTAVSTTVCYLQRAFPVPMYGTPVFSHTGTFSTSTWEVFTNSTTAITLTGTTAIQAGVGANTPYTAIIQTTSPASLTAGFGCELAGAGGTSSIIWSADF